MSKNTEIVLQILKNEVCGDTESALQKMSSDYSMTWMYMGNEGPFPCSKDESREELDEIYKIKGRKYEIKNIAENDDVVMVELIESYPDKESGKIYRTPLVLVLRLEDGKIKSGRHYCDPKISFEKISNEQLNCAYQNAPTKIVIE